MKENNILVEVKVINTPLTGEVKVKKLESESEEYSSESKRK